MDDFSYDDYDPDDDYGDYFEHIEHFEPRFNDLMSECLWPSLTQTTGYLFKLIIVNVIFCLLTQSKAIEFNNLVKHVISIALGAFLILLQIEEGHWYIFGFALVPYLLLFLLNKIRIRRFGYTVSAVVGIALFVCEWLKDDKKQWPHIRGVLMIIVMKVISLSFDIDAGKPKEFPEISNYCGYILCPASVINGPWHSYIEYLNNFRYKPWNLKYFGQLIFNVVLSLGFLLCSNCLAYWLIPDESFKWFVAYRDAFAFRCSHYFISYLSQATMVAAGFTSIGSSELFGYEVTKPHKVELPRSLVQVVINWNIPMHHWLKTYVFRIVNPYGTFKAIVFTYIVSTALHGFNVQVAIVLLHLSIYTYIEYTLRKKSSSFFDSCTLAKTCTSPCRHTNKSDTIVSRTINVVFYLFAILHLAYLGMNFEVDYNSKNQGWMSIWQVWDRWHALSYLSHILLTVEFLFISAF